MKDAETKALKVKGKQEVTGPAEQTRPGLIFTPDVDIFETEKELILLADIPGVRPEDLNIDLRENTLTLVGEVFPAEDTNEEDVVIEYETGKYFRQFTLSEVVDQDRIVARLNDGVLRLTLPKIEKATPRKIEIKIG